MKTLYIVRQASTDQGTPGFATCGAYDWASLELPDRSNQPNFSCIPPGRYVATRKHSEHFGREVLLLECVPGRSDVEMHPANWAGDITKGWHSDLRGCLALGIYPATLPYNGKLQTAVAKSADALDQLLQLMGDEQSLEIIIRSPAT